ncbi:MAG: undecaprenyl-diphosphatase UppP [Omnitrophica WOR_2 bacterium]
MTILQSIVLGIIQGLTEFIPVSSTAHLLLAQHFFNWQIPEAFKFDVLVQLGTLLALIVYFWRDLVSIILAVLQGLWNRQPFADPQARLGWYLVLATIPASIVGLVLKKVVEALFANPGVEAVIRLLISAMVLFIAERFGRKDRTLNSLGWLDALWVGIAQILAVFPGSSRSGSTIFGGMLRGFDRPSAARFAFLLAVPTMLGAGLVEGIGLLKVPNLSQILPDFAVGFLVAAVVGYLSIRWLLGYLNRHSLYVFSAYCALVGLVVLGTLIL